ncbi:hypothetical protein H4S08_000245 [Coemansia sp. RSA 1365]|nr:hypothetical protein H4S08_000245 [Coemansia sp. RSA 1365]
MRLQGNGLKSGNGLAVGTRAYMHSTLSNNYVIESHMPPGLGISQVRDGTQHSNGARTGDAGFNFITEPGCKARKGKTPICSNWYYKEKMLSDSRFIDQEFESSGEENFDSEENGYSGDILVQQQLIQKQQRTIFDLNMRCKVLTAALTAKTGNPHSAILDDFVHTCDANCCADCQLDCMRSEVANLRDERTRLENATTNLPQSTLLNGIIKADQPQLDKARRVLTAEPYMATQCMCMLEDKDAHICKLQGELVCECLNSDHGYCVATDFCKDAKANTFPALMKSRVRAESATTSAAVKLCTVSQNSPSVDHRILAKCNQLQEQYNQLQLELRKTEMKRSQLGEELKESRKKMREYEKQHCVLQLEIKRSLASRLATDSKSDQAYIVRYKSENGNDDASDSAADSASLHAENAKLKIECRDVPKQAEMTEENVRRLQEELGTISDNVHRFCHDYLRPHLRQLTVDPDQVETNCDYMQCWNQLGISVSEEETETFTQSSSGISDFSDLSDLSDYIV